MTRWTYLWKLLCARGERKRRTEQTHQIECWWIRPKSKEPPSHEHTHTHTHSDKVNNLPLNNEGDAVHKIENDHQLEWQGAWHMRSALNSIDRRALQVYRTLDRRPGQWQCALAAPLIHPLARSQIHCCAEWLHSSWPKWLSVGVYVYVCGCHFRGAVISGGGGGRVYAPRPFPRTPRSPRTPRTYRNPRRLGSCIEACACVCGREFIYAFINQLTKCKFCIFHTRKKLNETDEKRSDGRMVGWVSMRECVGLGGDWSIEMCSFCLLWRQLCGKTTIPMRNQQFFSIYAWECASNARNGRRHATENSARRH